jgi:hypothetical protein
MPPALGGFGIGQLSWRWPTRPWWLSSAPRQLPRLRGRGGVGNSPRCRPSGWRAPSRLARDVPWPTAYTCWQCLQDCWQDPWDIGRPPTTWPAPLARLRTIVTLRARAWAALCATEPLPPLDVLLMAKPLVTALVVLPTASRPAMIRSGSPSNSPLISAIPAASSHTGP